MGGLIGAYDHFVFVSNITPVAASRATIEIIDNGDDVSITIPNEQKTINDLQNTEPKIPNPVRNELVNKLNRYILGRNNYLDKVNLTIRTILFRNTTLTAAKLNLAIGLRDYFVNHQSINYHSAAELINQLKLSNQHF